MSNSKTDSTTNRSLFEFSTAARDKFDFLLQRGFMCVKSEEAFVRYESGTVFINIYHGHASFEIALEIGLLEQENVCSGYSMSEIIRVSDVTEADKYRNFTAASPELIKSGLQFLSEKFKNYANGAISGGTDYFYKLKNQRMEWVNSYASQVLSSQIRPLAEAAFRDKNYKEVVRLYDSILSELNHTELSKLKYAKSKI